MKDGFLMLIIGIVIGAIITAAGFIMFDNKNENQNENSNLMGNMQPKEMIDNTINKVHDAGNNISESMNDVENTDMKNMTNGINENAIEEGIKNPGETVRNVVNEVENTVRE